MKNKILNLQHPAWNTVCCALCNSLKADQCDGTTEKTEEVLASFSGIDVEATLALFNDMGCECDGAILDLLLAHNDEC